MSENPDIVRLMAEMDEIGQELVHKPHTKERLAELGVRIIANAEAAAAVLEEAEGDWSGEIHFCHVMTEVMSARVASLLERIATGEET